MPDTWTPWVGIVAATLTTSSFIPQALKTLRTRSAHDFSWPYLLMFGLGIALWALYGVQRQDFVIVGANIITLGLVIAIGSVKAQGQGKPPR